VYKVRRYIGHSIMDGNEFFLRDYPALKGQIFIVVGYSNNLPTDPGSKAF
jgi:hypothetical protein